MSKKLIFIYDLDNTIYRESDYLYEIIKIFSNLFNLNINQDISSYFIEENLNRRQKDLLSNLYNLCYKRQISNHEHEILFKIYSSAKVRINIFYKMSDVLKLSKKYGYNILCTNGKRLVQENKIKLLGIEKFFDRIIILEDFFKQKPNPAEIKKRINKIEHRGIIVIGDDPLTDVLLAKNMGAISIRIKRGFYKKELCNADYEVDNIFRLKYILLNIINNPYFKEVKNERSWLIC